MHAHDRTMLAGLGFADPDKKDPRHDWACQYLAEPERAAKLPEMLLKTGPVPWEAEFRLINGVREFARAEKSVSNFRVHRAEFERPVSKGEGQYKTTIGFIDVFLRFKGVETFSNYLERTWRSNGGGFTDWEKVPDWDREVDFFLPAEIKISSCTVGDMLRQIRLYREYFNPGPQWLLATAFPLSTIDVQQLAEAKIVHVRLGTEFDAYCDRRRSDAADAKSPEI